jgi:Effector-associated domain 1
MTMQMLPSEQREMLANAIIQAFPDVSSLQIFTRGRLGRNVDEFSRESMPKIVEAMITHYESNTRANLVDFLTKLAAVQNDVLRAVAGALSETIPPAPFFEPFEHTDPCQSLFPRDRAFLDRNEVRLRIAELRSADGGPRTLVIDGGSSSGKTHTFELVRHVAAAVTPSFKHVYVDLRNDTRGGYDAGQLMRTLGRKMKLDVDAMPEKQAQTTAWLRELRDWFIGEVNETETFWWLVIDGISQVDPMQDVRDMISLLVTEVEQNTDALRLLLLGCTDDAIMRSGRQVVRVTLLPITSDDIRAFMENACKRARISIDAKALDAAVEFVVNALPQEPYERLQAIARHTEDATREMLKSARGRR